MMVEKNVFSIIFINNYSVDNNNLYKMNTNRRVHKYIIKIIMEIKNIVNVQNIK